MKKYFTLEISYKDQYRIVSDPNFKPARGYKDKYKLYPNEIGSIGLVRILIIPPPKDTWLSTLRINIIKLWQRVMN